MSSCPRGKIAGIDMEFSYFHFIGHVKEVIYMLVYDEELKIE